MLSDDGFVMRLASHNCADLNCSRKYALCDSYCKECVANLMLLDENIYTIDRT